MIIWKSVSQANCGAAQFTCKICYYCQLLTTSFDGAGFKRRLVPRTTISFLVNIKCTILLLVILYLYWSLAIRTNDYSSIEHTGIAACVFLWFEMIKAERVIALVTFEGQEIGLPAGWTAAVCSYVREVRHD